MKRIVALINCFLVILLIAGCTHFRTGTNGLARLNYRPGRSTVVTINHNRSTLDPRSWRTDHIRYAHLDRLNRSSSGSTAYLDSANVANDSLRQRQFVYPSGWHQKMLNGQPIINRGHLIAYSLSKGINVRGRYQSRDSSGDQNNLRNLFTQTAFSNQKVQTIYESRVRQALRHGKRVIFRAQPVFRGNEIMARGVHLQAIATDRSLNFNVYLFNVQPGVRFDYATGRSVVDSGMRMPTPKNAPNFARRQTFPRSFTERRGRDDWRYRDYRYHPARPGRFPRRKLLQVN